MRFFRNFLLVGVIVLFGFGCQTKSTLQTQTQSIIHVPSVTTSQEIEPVLAPSATPPTSTVVESRPLVIGEIFTTSSLFYSEQVSKIFDFPLHKNFTSDKITYTLSYIPFTFQLSEKYGFTESTGFEGGFGSSVNFGERVKGNHFRSGPLGMRITSSLPNYLFESGDDSNLTPEEKIQALRDVYIKTGNVAYRIDTFFGNPGIISGAGDGLGFIGFVSSTQFPDKIAPGEVLYVDVNYGTYGSGVSEDYDVFQELISSIRLK